MFVNNVDVYDMNGVKEVLSGCGLDDFEMDALVSIIKERVAEELEDSFGGYIWKSEYETEVDGITSEMNDILTECDNLDGRSCKGNTRADIAHRIRECCSNIESINGCHL